MPEIPGNRYEGQENRNSEKISVFDSQKYQSELQGFYKNNINNPDSIQTLKDFVDKQEQDKTKLKENLEKPILNETREQLDKQAMINEAKIMLYEKTGIDNNLENNSVLENFIKGVIDGGILDNYDLALQVYETNGKIILDGLKELASWEGLKNLASTIGEDIGTLFTGNAYERGKVSAEVVLALLTAGAGLTINVAKKGVKLGIKELSKLRVNKERLVESSEVKNVINETNTKLDEIVTKKQLDFEKLVVEDIAKLGDKDRIEAGKFYLGKEKLLPEQQEAIIKAHEVGNDRVGAGINNYSFSEKLEKVKILNNSGFSKEERRVLLEKGVCGKSIDTSNVDDVISKLSELEGLDISVAKELIDKGYLDEVLHNLNSFEINSIVDLLPNQEKIIDYYKNKQKTLKDKEVLEGNYGLFQSISEFKIGGKQANEIDGFRCTHEKLDSYNKEELLEKGLDIDNPDIKKQFDEYKEYVGFLQLEVEEIIKKSEKIHKEFNQLLKDVGEASNVSKVGTDIIKDGKVRNGIHNEVPIKKVDRIMEKVLAPGFYDGNINKIGDIVRGTLEYDKIGDLYKGLYLLMESGVITRQGGKIFIKDNIGNIKGKDVHPQGYKNVNSSIKISTDSIVELQFQLKGIMEATNVGIDLAEGTVKKMNFTKYEFMLKWDGRPNYDLPINDNKVVGHDILELWRTIPNETTRPELKELKGKLDHLLKEIYKQAGEKAL